MPRYINADKLIAYLTDGLIEFYNCDGYRMIPEEVKEIMENAVEHMETADVREVMASAWIPFTKRELTAEEQEEHPEWCYILECPLPEDGQEILVSNGKYVWLDVFCVDDGCYLDSDHELEGCAWMPLPKPFQDGKKEESDA